MHPKTMATMAGSGAFSRRKLCKLGGKSRGVLELTALPTIRKESWVPAVREADALPVWGGDVLNLCHWMRQSGLAEFDQESVPSGSDMVLEAEISRTILDFPRLGGNS